jgi:REP element-mobilizing transposase RayT
MNDTEGTPGRKYFDHAVPEWIDPEARDFFITVCCQQRGENQLCTPTLGPVLLATARFYFEQKKWLPSVFLLMPDHVHMIVSFAHGQTMERVVRNWKRYTATKHQIAWQRDFFDHRVRSAFDFHGRRDYILQNPVRAGLVKEASDWPFVLQLS